MSKYFLTTLLGLMPLALGIVGLKVMSWQSLPYVLIGLGCGLFGHGLGNISNVRILAKAPEAAYIKQIAQKDERNIFIANAAKAKAFDAFIFIFCPVLLSLNLMQVELKAILLLVAVYLAVLGLGIYYRFKLEKEF